MTFERNWKVRIVEAKREKSRQTEDPFWFHVWLWYNFFTIQTALTHRADANAKSHVDLLRLYMVLQAQVDMWTFFGFF